MKKTPIQLMRDLVDAFTPATEMVDDGRLGALAAEYISHDAPTITELREKVVIQAKRMLEDADPHLAPRWEDAPAWANWLAQDYDAKWYWYESQPQTSTVGAGWLSTNGDRTHLAKRPTVHACNSTWRDTLQARQ